MRNLICLLVLLGFLTLVRSGLYAALDAYGFWPFMAIGCISIALIVCAAFAYDYFEARSRQH